MKTIAFVTCKALVPEREWDHDDLVDNPVGSYTFHVEGANREALTEAALDQFHSTVPIAMLENFDINVKLAGEV